MKNVIANRFLYLKCENGCTAYALDILGNVEVIDAVACEDDLAELFTELIVGCGVNAYGIDSIVGYRKAKIHVVRGGIVLLFEGEEDGLVIGKAEATGLGGNGNRILGNAVSGTEGMGYSFLNALAVLCFKICGNNNGVVRSVLDVVRNELPLLVAVRAVPLAAELTACRKVVDLNLFDLIRTDRACKLKLDGRAFVDLVNVVDFNVRSNADILSGVNVDDHTLDAVISEPIICIAVEGLVNIHTVVLVKTVAKVVCNSGSNKTEEGDVKVARQVCGGSVKGIIGALVLT